MPSQNLCNLAACATRALDKSVCAVVSVAALEQYNQLVELIKQQTCIDINQFFVCISLLAVVCWVSRWIEEMIAFMCVTFPKFIKNLLCGKLTLCIFDCEHKSEKSEHGYDDDSFVY